jgi:Zn-dependent peptidase ImmA (M78 family)
MSVSPRRSPLTKSSFNGVIRRLSRAGFDRRFVQSAILPDWWSEECASDAELMPEIELRVARFLGQSLSLVRDAREQLAAPEYAEAQLRRVRDVDRDRLAPAIHSALQIGAAAVRSLRDYAPSGADLPADPLKWRRELSGSHGTVTLDEILGDLWKRGIPVVPLDVLPAPSFQGLACVVEGHPVILLGHRHDEPGRVAFFVLHEAAHIAAGDCSPDRPVVDEEDLIVDETEIEKAADEFATRVLVGEESVPELDGGDFKELATNAASLESETGADASTLIFAWAAKTGDYAAATMAVKALYRGSGARRKLREYFDRYVGLESATETDRALLRCVHGDSESDEAAA